MTKPDVYIYLDEFERDDVFVLSAAFVPADRASQLLADWDALRLKIKKVLLRDYPRAAQHSKLQGNQLPEIHAVDLFQSKGYYRKYKHGTKNDDAYWLQHYEWLEEALKIIQKHDINFVPLPLPHMFAKQRAKDLLALIDFIDSETLPGAKYTYTRSKIESLANKDYLYILPALLITIENWLRELDQIGEVICDDHEMSKGFSVSKSIDWLRQNGHYNHTTAPRFASGLDETLLQVCDVLCYVSGRRIHAKRTNITLREPLRRWSQKYVEPASAPVLEPPEERWSHVIMIIFDLFLEFSIRDKKEREALQNYLKDITLRSQANE